jgi:hypothetical protein
MVSADLIQPIPKIFCIRWVMSADTNKAQSINTAHTPLFRLSTTVVAATVLIESNCSDRDYLFELFFSTFSNMFLPFFAMVYIDLDFHFTMISLMDLGLFPCIYSKGYRIILMYIF